MYRTQQEWVKAYEDKGALWIHDSDPFSPHAVLTSGLHSDGFFNSRPVSSDDKLLREAAADLIEMLSDEKLSNLILEELLETSIHQSYRPVDVVVGPETGATKLAEAVAKILTTKLGYLVHWVSPKKAVISSKKVMVIPEESLQLFPNARVLHVEDVCTTGGSVKLTDEAVLEAGATSLPFMLVLVNRSGEKVIDGRKVLALIDHKMEMREAEKCPWCKLGSEAIPKVKDNWAKLTKKQ